MKSLHKMHILIHCFLCLLACCGVSWAGNEFVLNNETISQYLIQGSNPRIIHIPKGVYKVYETLRMPSNTIVEGDGPETILQAASPFIGQRFITNSNSRSGNTGITLRSFSVRYDIADYKGDTPGIMRFENVDNLKIIHVNFDVDSSYYAIDFASAVRNSSVEGCRIRNKGKGGGIMVRNSNTNTGFATSNISIVENYLASSIVDEPLAVFGWLGEVRDVLIAKNNVLAVGASFGISVFAVDQKGHSGKISAIKVLGNTVKGGNIGGITAKGGARDIEIIGNNIRETRGDGIFLHSGGEKLPAVSNVLVRKNEIIDSGRHCIFATGTQLRIENNTLANCRESGVYLGGQVEVTGNRITNARPGILVATRIPKVVKSNMLINAIGVNSIFKDYNGVSDNLILKK